MSEPRIVVVGSTMIDLVAYADRLPNDGETVVGTSYQTGFGGKGANQAVVAARFGAQVAMVNTLGDDNHGDAYLQKFADEGIDTSFIRRTTGSSGVAPIWVDASGMNRIIIVPGANNEVRPDVAAEAITALAPQVVIGQFEIPQATTAAAFAAARGLGARTILNPAPGAGVDPELMGVSDWLVPNETEFTIVTGQMLPGAADPDGELDVVTATTDRLGASLVVTLGERGAVVAMHGEHAVRVDTPRVTAVDTTGAGDAFVGAFAVGLGLGMTAVDAARLGCAAAADSVTRLGTQTSYPDRAGAAAILAVHR